LPPARSRLPPPPARSAGCSRGRRSAPPARRAQHLALRHRDGLSIRDGHPWSPRARQAARAGGRGRAAVRGSRADGRGRSVWLEHIRRKSTPVAATLSRAPGPVWSARPGRTFVTACRYDHCTEPGGRRPGGPEQRRAADEGAGTTRTV
jgi:hypothetical protein